MALLSRRSREIFYGGTVIILLFFMFTGYLYPAADAGDRVPFKDDSGTYNGGKLTGLFAFIFFTISVFILGRSLFTTFIKMGMSEWNLFAIGIFLFFIHGLAGVLQSVFDHALFSMIKDLILPVGLLLVLYSSLRIYEPFREKE